MDSMRYAHSEGHTDLCFSSDFKSIITCGSEGDVRIWKGVNDADQTDMCVGEKATAVAQNGSNLYVGTDSNLVQTYTFPDLELDGIITRFTGPISHLQISKDGRKILAGSSDMEIHVVDLKSLDCEKFIGHSAPVLSVCFDPLMELLVSSSCDGTVRVWSYSSTKDVLKQWEVLNKSNSFESSKTLCRMDFNPCGTLLAIPANNNVTLYERTTWAKLQTFSGLSSQEFSIAKFSPCGKLLVAGTTTGDVYVWEIKTEKTVINEFGETKYAITGVAWNKNSSELVFCNIAGQLGHIIVPSTQNEKINGDLDNDMPLEVPEIDDDDDDDDNVISLDKIKADATFRGSTASLASSKDSESDCGKEPLSRFKLPISELQDSFQPSSSPQHLQQRYMVWNEFGIIRQFNGEGVNDVDVEFHNTSRNHGIRLNNVLGHTVGTLSEKAIVLGCPSSERKNILEDDDRDQTSDSSKVVVILQNSSDGQKEWDVSFDEDNENVVGLAVGDTWVAVATTSSHIRLFSMDGSQMDIISLPGPFLCMTGHRNLLGVVFHSGIGSNGDQYLSYYLIQVNETKKRLSVAFAKPFPISRGSTLRWIGFSDEGSFASFDSSGIVRLLYGSTWRPILYLNKQCKSKFDHYFVIGISEADQSVRAILCKGAFYPPVLPKPITSEIKWQIPLCERDSEKGKLEEEYLRCSLSVNNIMDDTDMKKSIEKTISITVMKLFALACRSGLDARAISLCQSMPTLEVVKLSSKYAAKLGRHQLSQKVNEIASQMIEPTNEMENDNDREPQYSFKSNNIRSTSPTEKESYSQDLFEESQPCVPTGSNERESIILNSRKVPQESISPKPLRVMRLNNPFKVSSGGKVKQPALNSPSDNDMNKSNSGTFIDWFASNRENIQLEFPLLKENELIVMAMKRYRGLSQLNNSQQQDESESQETVLSCQNNKKRKSDDLDDKLQMNKSKKISSKSKLKNFIFSKQAE